MLVQSYTRKCYNSSINHNNIFLEGCEWISVEYFSCAQNHIKRVQLFFQNGANEIHTDSEKFKFYLLQVWEKENK